MPYWTTVCPRDTDPGVAINSLPNCSKSEFITVQAQMMIVPPAGSNYDGFWQLGSISISDALLISGSIAALWAVAWGFRQLRKAVSVGDVEPDD